MKKLIFLIIKIILIISLILLPNACDKKIIAPSVDSKQYEYYYDTTFLANGDTVIHHGRKEITTDANSLIEKKRFQALTVSYITIVLVVALIDLFYLAKPDKDDSDKK